jgi:DNA-binding IclR family transcriptional regulator
VLRWFAEDPVSLPAEVAVGLGLPLHAVEVLCRELEVAGLIDPEPEQ